MTRRAKAEHASGHTVLLVDDNPDYLQATRLLLEREGHNVLTATNGPEALAILPQQRVDLLLLDYFMPGMTGEEVVNEVRKVDPFVQVILQTGYASEQPPRELLNRLDIQGYYDKTEGPEQLLLWTAVGLKASFSLQLLSKGRRGIEFILERTPDLHRLQSTRDVASEVLRQAATLMAEIGAGAQATGFVGMLDADADLVLSAGTGEFPARGKLREMLDGERVAAVDVALEEARVQLGAYGTIVPLRVGPLTVGVLFLDKVVSGDQALSLVRMLANQAAAALQNAQLYEMAAIDPLTETHTRIAFDRALVQELAASARGGNGVGLVLVDVDGMKAVNAQVGHVAGDQALRELGRMLRHLTRAGDVVGRFGNDAFGIVLRDPMVVGPARLADRVRELLKDYLVVGPSGEARLRVSIGFAVLEPKPVAAEGKVSQTYFQSVAERLAGGALAALEEAQRSGGNATVGAAAMPWPSAQELGL